MTFVDMDRVAVSAGLKSAHYAFPRSRELKDAFTWCVTDYYAKMQSGIEFEARGLIVTGKSRVGKTSEIKRLMTTFNASVTNMPDGRPARIVHCLLSGKVTWKDLGIKVLDALGYPMQEGRRTQNYIWEMVCDQARRQNVIGIHFDECQHVFSAKEGRANSIILDSLKTLLKDSRWPLILILSGIPVLASHVQGEEQLARLLRPVHFNEIDIDRDLDELNRLAFAFADKAGLEFGPLSNDDFLRRLDFACTNRWGLVIELLIEAFIVARRAGAGICATDHFDEAFALTYGTPAGF